MGGCALCLHPLVLNSLPVLSYAHWYDSRIARQDHAAGHPVWPPHGPRAQRRDPHQRPQGHARAGEGMAGAAEPCATGAFPDALATENDVFTTITTTEVLKGGNCCYTGHQSGS